MRNLKKILALVLALVMSLSLMATAGAADFTDASDINEKYETAIEVLEGLGVFKGYQDGTFQPTGSITRAETAAIIYRIVTGDVKDEQVGIYADYNLFTDVPSTSWFAGYVNYCANAEYIKGVGGGKFEPNSQVTGYAALAMILRAIGYTANGGFTGSDWEVQTARTAEARKITKNILTGTLGQNADRETVAEILFQAILVNMVDHNVDNTFNGDQGYFEKDITLGYKTFGLEELEGVVVANEFANLYGTSVLANGKTNFEVAKDDVRSLDVTTELTDMGERQHAYITGSTVLSMDNTGLNTVKENDGAAVVIDTAARFQAAAGMPAASDIEYFVNFDRVGQYTCDQRLEFRVTFADARAMASFDTYAGVDISSVAAADNLDNTLDNNWTVSTNVNLSTLVGNDNATNLTTAAAPLVPGNLNATAEDYIFATTDWPVSFKKVIRAGNDISDADLSVIRGIFGAADNSILINSGSTSQWAKDQITGDVFVGTKSTNNTITDEERDLSNTIGYNKFFEEYINAEVYDVNWDRADNGEWVKFIDNDGDGAADYAFLTTSNMDEALSTYAKGDATVTEYYTFSDDADNWYSVRYLGDTPAVGDVVLYSFIDGQYLVEAAATETVKVTDYSWKDDQIITDKGTYGQSGIENWTEMMELISAMADDTTYAVYFDHFGYVRAYEIPGGPTYALVTEIYARNNANGNLVQEWPMNVELVVKDADATEYNLVGGGRNIFVANTPWAQIENLAAVGNYYNWLQPAIQHLGVTRTGLGATKVSPTFAGDWNNTSTFWPANRQVIRNITSIPAGDTFNYGTGNYGERATVSATTRRVTNWNQAQGATASFTNIAKVSIDGENATLTGAAQVRTDNRNNVMSWPNSGNARYAVDYIQLSLSDVVKGQARYPIYGSNAAGSYAANNNYYVNAVDTTEYYIVYNGDVLYFTGYANMPALTNADNIIHAAYAVARDTSADSANLPYWVADVIVYEVENYAAPGTTGVSLAYYNPSRNDQQVQLLDTLSDKATPADVDLVPQNLAWNADAGQFDQYSGYGFYLLTNPSAVEDGKMTASSISRIRNVNANDREFSKNGIFAGTITRIYVLAGSNYIDINTSGLPNTDGTLRTDVSLKLDNNIYSITEQVVNEGTWNQITRNVATNLRYDGRQGFVANSQVKPNDRVIWVGKAPTNGTVGESSFIVDLGNDRTAGDDANFGLHAITPDWLYNRTIAADGVAGEINGVNEQAHGWGLWQDIMTEQAAGPATVAAPDVYFYGVKATRTGTDYTVSGGVNYSAAAAGTTNGIAVTDGKIVMANTTITNDGANAQTTRNADASVTYTGTILGKDGKTYYRYTFTQNAANTGALFQTSVGPIGTNGPNVAQGINAPADASGTIYNWLSGAALTNASAGATVTWRITLNDSTVINGTGTGSNLVLTPDDYNATGCGTIASVVATVVSEDGKTTNIYTSANATPTFTLTIGPGIKVFPGSWDGTNFAGTAETTDGTLGVYSATASRTWVLNAGNSNSYVFAAVGEGTWSLNGGVGRTSNEMFLNGNSIFYAVPKSAGSVTFTATPAAEQTKLNVVYGTGAAATAVASTSAKVTTNGTNALPYIFDKGSTVSLMVEPDSADRVASVKWTNGSLSGELKHSSGYWYEIPAEVTATLDASKPVTISVVLATKARTLAITNSSSSALEVTYLANPAELDGNGDIKLSTKTIAAGATLSATNISTLGTVTIVATAANANITVTQDNNGAPNAHKTANNTWESEGIVDNLNLTVTNAG